MLNLLTGYSVEEILFFIVLLGLAIKGVVDFWDWAVERVKQNFNKEHTETQEIENLYNRLNTEDEILQKLNLKQDELQRQLKETSQQVSLLLQSDMDDIKSFITKEHHFYCYEQKWIDDYDLNCIEQRYAHYEAEGGNSFIDTFMKEIRALPKIPPDEKIEKE